MFCGSFLLSTPFTWTPQAAAIAFRLLKSKGKLENKVYDVPPDIDREISRLKLKGMGIKIDILTPEQERYLASWQEGT